MTLLLTHKAETIRSFQAFAEGREMPEWPAEVFLELSNICDLKCAMCPTFSALNPYRLFALKGTERGFLDAKAIAHPLETVLKHALSVHCFGYGEPTIHPDFRETIEYLSRFEVMVDFFTNGMHLDEALAEFLVQARVHKVTVSFSGATKDDYENVYLGGHFERVLGGMRNLADSKKRAGSRYPMIVVNSLAFQHHIEGLDSFVELMSAHGVEHVEVKPLLEHAATIHALTGHAAIIRPEIEGRTIERARARASELGLRLLIYDLGSVDTAEQAGKSHQVIPVSRFKQTAGDTALIRPKDEVAIRAEIDLSRMAAEAILEELDFEPPISDDGSPEIFYCMEPFKTLYVRRSGEVKPCCFAVGPSLGAIGAQDGESVWRGTGFSTMRESILAGLYPMDLCGGCLKHKTAPRHHFVDAQSAMYANWHRAAYGSSGLAEIELPDNAGIVRSIMANNPMMIAENAFQGGMTALRDRPELQAAFRNDKLNRLRAALAGATAKARQLRVEGHLDFVGHARVCGWVWSALFPDHRFTVSVWHEGALLASGTADAFRRDLELAGKGDGRYHFEFVYADPLSDDASPADTEIRVEGTDLIMRQSAST